MSLLTLIQIFISIALIVLILLQEKSGGIGGAFGGSDGGFYQTKRGLDKIFFISTIVLIIIFTLLSLLNLIF